MENPDNENYVCVSCQIPYVMERVSSFLDPDLCLPFFQAYANLITDPFLSSRPFFPCHTKQDDKIYTTFKHPKSFQRLKKTEYYLRAIVIISGQLFLLLGILGLVYTGMTFYGRLLMRTMFGLEEKPFIPRKEIDGLMEFSRHHWRVIRSAEGL